ncbi:MAG TPA: RNA polymerase sigma factor [Gammaproteobacteria bacterium]|nr:RNA polymerase sigma factor [Gammaproteobacteria bacterium]
MTSKDDGDLVARMLNGEQKAFNEFFSTYADRLYRFALKRMGDDTAGAEDAVQQTLCRAVERLEQFKGESALFTWLCRICRNTIVDMYRGKAARHNMTVPFEDTAEIRAALESISEIALVDPQQHAIAGQVESLVRSVLDYLPRRYGDVLEWKYMQGLTVKEISERLDVTPKAAESVLNRARLAFREGVARLGNVEAIHASMST